MDGTGQPTIRTTCPYCGVGCGVLARPDGMGGLTVEGDPDHPANKGRLCSKGLALGETMSQEGRALTPMINGTASPWEPALNLVAERFNAAIRDHGPDSVAFYLSGQLLTEDYYVANKLMKGFIGSANVDTNSRLCMASTVAGHKRAFGADTVPGTYEDLEAADLVVLVGSNLAWCHPVLYQRLAAARATRGTKVVVVDPRRTATCDIADLHLKIAPGSDVALFNGLLAHIDAVGAVDHDFVRTSTEGFAEALELAASHDGGATGLPAEMLDQFYTLFAETERSVTVFSQGVNQSSSGVDKVNGILNCHLATGRIGKPGMGPFSVTGQPNAMGGRETGGLANMLAAHLDLENDVHKDAVQTFWAAPRIAQKPGLKAVDMFKAVADGRIRALWIACTNPVVSMPEADAVKEAIEACPFVVVSDVSAETDTARLADVILPAAGWGEKDGTVTNSDRVISRQRATVPIVGEAKADWEIFAEIGKRMGWPQAFDYAGSADVFREHARLSAVAGAFGRDFDISGLATINEAEYDTLAPTRWPVTATRRGGRFFGDGRFFTPSGKARFLAVRQKPLAAQLQPEYPFRLNTGRVRDQWHTMTRTAKSPRLSRHMAEPYLAIHPSDAAKLALAPADLAEVKSPTGSAILRVFVTEDATIGMPFAPMHWTAENAPNSRIGPLVASATDPISGQPELKAGVVAIAKYAPEWYGFAVSREKPSLAVDYAATMRTNGGWRTEFAGRQSPKDWEALAETLLGVKGEVETLKSRAQTRLAYWQGDDLIAALFVAAQPVVVARDFVSDLLIKRQHNVLAARPAADLPDHGPVVCSCMSIGRNQILNAQENAPAASLDQICEQTGAGVTCGSCRPEIAALLARARKPIAAE